MSVVTMILATGVAVEFLYIMYLETFATDSAATSRVFGIGREELGGKSLNVLFKNQGVYNGLVAVLIVLAVYVFPSKLWIEILLGYVIAVSAFGALTSSPSILLKQGGLAILALLSCWIW